MFKPVKLDWGGKSVEIPANRLLGAIALVEDIITFNELISFSKRGAYPTARIAQAYGELLRYAGLSVEDDEVYAGIFANAQDATNVTASMQLLMMIMVPTNLHQQAAEPVLAPGEEPPGKSKAANRSKSSRAISSSSSRKGGVRR